MVETARSTGCVRLAPEEYVEGREFIDKPGGKLPALEIPKQEQRRPLQHNMHVRDWRFYEKAKAVQTWQKNRDMRTSWHQSWHYEEAHPEHRRQYESTDGMSDYQKALNNGTWALRK